MSARTPKSLPRRVVEGVAKAFDFYGDGPTPEAVAYAARETHYDRLSQAVSRNVARQTSTRGQNAS